ncbi:GNAT family N-acetyltransferase [Streptomyces sp. NPDC047072]|uniref:GNAT family N-acetyltransferase n=1 Tax=Streptomyces sp. NPDC047072 TaxID=3154809 RepID=UPI0033F7CBAE
MNAAEEAFPVREATAADVDAVVDTFTTAFFHDPVWGPVFPDAERRAEQAAPMWRVYTTAALRHRWLLVTPDVEAAAVWIPAGEEELTAREAAELDGLLERAAGPAVAHEIHAIGKQFEAARPTEPHFYLTILGTHDRHRGKGLGMRLLAAGLERVDALGAPVYLESTNPANLERYASVGFTPHGRITTASGQVVTTMWRPAR